MNDIDNNIFSWEHLRIYLAGPIEFAINNGSDWRQDFVHFLVNDLELSQNHIFNPNNKPLKNTTFFKDINDETAVLNKYKRCKDWDGMCRHLDEIALTDLRLVDKSDIIIAHFPKDQDDRRIPTYGTIEEVIRARLSHKTVYLVWPGGKETCSAWLMWRVGHQNIFENFSQLQHHMLWLKQQHADNRHDWFLNKISVPQKQGLIKHGEVTTRI